MIKRSVILNDYGSVDNLQYITSKYKPPSSSNYDNSITASYSSSPTETTTTTTTSRTVKEVGLTSSKSTQVTINIKACGISHLDVQVRKGTFSFLTSPMTETTTTTTTTPTSDSHLASSHSFHSIPQIDDHDDNDKGFILGYEIAGIVRSVGSDVTNRFKVGDHVAALLPLDHHTIYRDQYDHQYDDDKDDDEYGDDDDDDSDNYRYSKYSRLGGGYSDYVTIDAHYVVKIPEEMAFEKAASCILSGIRAYSFMFDHCKHLQRGASIFVQNGANVMQSLTIQLALSLNMHVWTSVSSDVEFNALSDLNPNELTANSNDTAANSNESVSSASSTSSSSLLRIIDMRLVDDFVPYMMQETGGLGVDAVLLDGSDNRFEKETCLLDNFVSVLGLNGTLVIPHCPFTPISTSKNNNNNNKSQDHDQLNCPTSVISQLNMAHFKNLYVKNGRIAFMFEQSYVLSCAQQGKFLHMLSDVINQVNSEKMDIRIAYSFPLEKVREAHRRIEQPNSYHIGKIVLKL